MDWKADDLLTWLLGEARISLEGREFVEQLGRKLIDCGAPVWRVRLGCWTIHPLFGAYSFTWSSDQAEVTESQLLHGFQDNDAYVGSPFQLVTESGGIFHRRLDKLDKQRDHKLLFDLADDGATDYLALPLLMSDGSKSIIVIASKAELGFSDEDIKEFEKLAAFIAPVFEVLIFQKLTRTILNTYVGTRTADRVLSGQIKRGDGDIINAAIWFCDLRGFTALSERSSSFELLGVLNEYFEIVVSSATSNGGEVLKFIGDAVLIVFPITKESDVEKTCQLALSAASEVFDRIVALNQRREKSGSLPINLGLGLHVGEVLYGNVGAPDRLDFTVIGAAVNKAARLEGLTKELGKFTLISSEFASQIGNETQSLGFFELKGIADAQEVFAPIGMW
ncbi:MAG: adenylate/guanylate cyclase domain-containing protein [Rhizobiaceae bacterium]